MSDLRLRWLGVMGVELSLAGKTLLIDPFLTRPGLGRVLFGRLKSDLNLLASHISRADYILITHAHYDHLMDAPALALQHGGQVFGSPNTGKILRAHGVPDCQFQPARPGEHYNLSPFDVETIAGRHVRMVIDPLVNGSLRRKLRAPLRLWDYRMDAANGFYIRAGDRTILFFPDQPRPCDILFTSSQLPDEYYRQILQGSRPRLFYPLHWDDFFRPLCKGLRPLESLWRKDFGKLFRLAAQASPQTRFSLPAALAELET